VLDTFSKRRRSPAVASVRTSRWISGSALLLVGILFGIVLSKDMGSAGAPVSTRILENAKVVVNRVTYGKGAVRRGDTRAHDQVIVFVDDASYEVVYANGKKETRTRKAGDAIWHSRGEEAPTLTNSGDQAYRTVVINLK
jgi:hypothetical protein